MKNVVIGLILVAVIGYLLDRNETLKESNNAILEENLCLKAELDDIRIARSRH